MSKQFSQHHSTVVPSEQDVQLAYVGRRSMMDPCNQVKPLCAIHHYRRLTFLYELCNLCLDKQFTMFRQVRTAIVSILQMFIPPPTLPSIKYYNTPDYDRLYFNDITTIKAENTPLKNRDNNIE